MSSQSITDFSLLINQQLSTQQHVEDCLVKAEALAVMARTISDYEQISQPILANYFWIISDCIEEALKANQVSLEILLKQTARNSEFSFSAPLSFME